jgi:hypothetical protein
LFLEKGNDVGELRARRERSGKRIGIIHIKAFKELSDVVDL